MKHDPCGWNDCLGIRIILAGLCRSNRQRVNSEHTEIWDSIGESEVGFTLPILFLPVGIGSRCATVSIWTALKDQSVSQMKGTLEYFRMYGLKVLDSLGLHRF